MFKAYRAWLFPQSTATITRRSVNLVFVVVAVLVAALLPALPARAAVITSSPLSTTSSTTATFAFSGDVGETFLCSLDSSYPAACTSPVTYSDLTVAAHSFTVYGQAVTGGPASSISSIRLSAIAAIFGFKACMRRTENSRVKNRR